MSAKTEQIDKVACTCCVKMNSVDREAFFQYQEEYRQVSGFRKRYTSDRVYYKGDKKGKARQVFDIDGREFNKLWDLLYPYAVKSVATAHYGKRTEEVNEDLADIKLLAFRILRFFGATPGGRAFSKCFPLIVNNALHSNFRKRGLPTRAQKDSATSRGEDPKVTYAAKKHIFASTSLFIEIGGDGEEGSCNLLDILCDSSDHTFAEVDILVSTPPSLRPAVKDILSGYTVSEVARKYSLKPAVLRKQLQSFGNCLRNS